MPRRKSPRDAQCPHCKKYLTKKGLLEHMRHVKCAPGSKATPRKWERARCKYCARSFHSSNSLRVHVSSQHPAEYRRSPNSVKAHRSPAKTSNAPPRPSKRASPSTSADKRNGHAEKRGSPERKKQKSAGVEAMMQNSPDPEASRRVWEEVLRRQLQKEGAATLRR